MQVLVVDDARIMRNIHKNALIEFNIPEDNIHEAGDGTSALQIAQNTDIGLFLVDWNMPGLNGLEFVKALRSMDKYKSTPIIMVTSEAAKYMVVEAINAGVTNYVVKPIKQKILEEKIGKYLKK